MHSFALPLAGDADALAIGEKFFLSAYQFVPAKHGFFPVADPPSQALRREVDGEGGGRDNA